MHALSHMEAKTNLSLFRLFNPLRGDLPQRLSSASFSSELRLLHCPHRPIEKDGALTVARCWVV